jgi:hypothetical protein
MRRSFVTLMAFAFIANAFADEKEPGEPRTKEDVDRVFDEIDRDSDDRISRSESQRATIVRDRFEGVDADQDGYLSRAEYRARPRDENFE